MSLISLFRKNVHETSLRELHDVIRAQRIDLLELRDELARLTAQHLKLRGRVYALWGAAEVPTGEGTARDALPLTDPRLTKAEIRARLQAAGALTPKKPTN